MTIDLRKQANVIFWVSQAVALAILFVFEIGPSYVRATDAHWRQGVVVCAIASVAMFVPTMFVLRAYVVERLMLPLMRWYWRWFIRLVWAGKGSVE